MTKFYSILFVAATVLILQSCQKQDVAPVVFQPQTTAYSSAVATDWMSTYRKAVQSEGKNPPQASRIYAYGAIGLYQAALPGMTEFRSLEGQIPGLGNMPVATAGKLNYTAAVNESMYRVALKIFGTLKPENAQLFEHLYQKYHTDLAGRIASENLTYSEDFGSKVAIAVLDRADNDNFATTRSLSYTVPSTSANASNWSPTGAALSPVEPYWGKLKCFAMADGGACTVKSKIPFSLDVNSDFYKQALEVATVGSNLTSEQKAIAKWWSDGSSQTATPPGHWVAIANQILSQRNMSLSTAAELYATLNIAMADAFISCWDEKYKLNLLRPVSYIRQYIPGFSNWTPILTTPPFPEYPSGHSVASSAAGDILTKLLGNSSFKDETNTDLGFPARTYNSFESAASEAAISRLYGGIHFREAVENGLKQGKEVSKAIFEKIRLRK